MKKTTTLLLVLAHCIAFSQESDALKKFREETKADVSVSKSTLSPNFIRFSNPELLRLKSQNLKEKAEEFLKENYKIFNLKTDKDFTFLSEKTDNYGYKNYIYKQSYQGVPIYDGVLKFHFNKKGQITSINGNTISNIKVNVQPDISGEQASVFAKDILEKQNLNHSKIALEVTKNNLIIFPKYLAQGGLVVPYLVYEIELTNKNDVREFLFIDGHTGELVEQFTGIHPIDRKLYETSVSSSNLKWQEGDAFPGTLDIWQQNEVATSEQIYNLFKNTFGYVSYDNADHSMVTINNNPNISCPNANWNGSTANYCTGVAADDVVAHEWGHAYTEYTSELIYQYQAGALNESYSDVWGETVDLLNNYQDDDENIDVRTGTSCSSGSLRWKMGEDATAFGGAIRDMWNPNCNGDPGSTLDASYYYCGTSDSGGVHTNSGVTNHLYALLVDGGTYNGYTISGIGFVKAAHLWFRAQSTYLTATSDFSNFADALESSCSDLIGVNLEGISTTATPAGLSGQSFTSSDLQNIKNAILAVQLRDSPATQCGYVPILGETPALCSSAVSSPLFTENWENGIGNWVITNIPTNASSWETRNWEIKNNLPKSRTGHAIFATDPVNGDCNTDLQNGILRIESPLITFPSFSSGKYEMAFNHYVATESTWDGGNIKYSLNGGSWTLLPASAFTYNAYNGTLVNSGNDNPLKGQRAFTGTDGGSLSGSWGQSVIDLSKIGVTSGSNIKFRFELGTDGCNGVEGWYVDEIYVYNCSSTLATSEVDKSNGLQVFPNPTSGIVTIQNNNNLKLKNLEIYTPSGQLIQRLDLIKNAKISTLDLGKLPRGNYILKINSENDSNSVKIIKK